MTTLRFDGTYSGLLTAIFYSYERKLFHVHFLEKTGLQPGLFDQEETPVILGDDSLSLRVIKTLRKRGGKDAEDQAKLIYLSENENRGDLIKDWISAVLQWGNQAFALREYPSLLKGQQLSQAVSNESHAFLGLLRFRELEKGGLYAPFEPMYNVLPLTVAHFMDRMPQETWIIHDLKRQQAALYQPGKLEFAEEVFLNKELEFSEEEIEFQENWKTYFKTIAIPGRIKSKLQMSHMPKRTWAYLIEQP